MDGHPSTEHRPQQTSIGSLISGPLVAQSLGINSQIGQIEGLHRIDVTVLRAQDLPRLKNAVGKKRQFFVTVTSGTTTKKTAAIRSVGQAVGWNEVLGAFTAHPSSHLRVSIYAKRSTGKDIPAGSLDIPFDSLRSSSQSDSEIAFVLSNPDVTEQPTIYLKITEESTTTNTSELATQKADSSQDNNVTVTSATFDSASSPLDGPYIESVTAVSLAEETRTDILGIEKALHDADQVVNSMEPALCVAIGVNTTSGSIESVDSVYKTWEKAVGTMKAVMIVVDKIAEIHPYAKVAWGVLSFIPKAFLDRLERDENIKGLLQDIHDVFDIGKLAYALNTTQFDSKQVQILGAMLRHVCNCGDFIQSYGKNPQFWKQILSLKSIIGKDATQIEDYRATLFRLRDLFLNHATVTTEITTLQILDNMGAFSTQLGGISTIVSDASLDAMIREIPYAEGSRFNSQKGCLRGTRTAFLDFIANWANNPDSERALVLFGQAGTGKSSIAHEVARRFNDMRRLSSSFVFRRGDGPKPRYLFTTLARDLADRYPSFKAALGEVIKDNTSLRQGARDYRTVFESLLIEPLKSVQFVGPIFVVIDALDESGDAMGRGGLHNFLADHISELPSNFRILITSRSESDILDAFNGIPAVRTLYTNDAELAAQTDNDIRIYLKKNLPPDIFSKHGSQLVKRAEGLFQWVAVACGYILKPPPGFTKLKCIRDLLLTSSDHKQLNVLDQLYTEVLRSYFTTPAVRHQFQSVMGPLLAVFKPLSIRSLSTLRRFAPIDDPDDDPDDDESISSIVSHLGSLLSNVTSTEDPVIPLHASFRDFLIDADRSGVFYIDLNHAHYQLAFSCLGLMVHETGLKFNICHLETSYLANKDIPDLEYLIKKHILPSLSYACCFWTSHLKHISFDSQVLNKLQLLFKEKFLFWLEVLSLVGFMNFVSLMMSSINAWLQLAHDHNKGSAILNLQALVNDGSAFVRYFAMVMAKSAPHIYLSALPFAPTSSLIAVKYAQKFPHLLSVKYGKAAHWPTLEMRIQAHSLIQSVAFSPDGQHIASGSYDKTVRVWNAVTGESVAGPFIGHSSSITSVTFSPDGQYLISGSDDNTIYVWNAVTGETVAGPYTGHTNSITSVACSSDGQHIVSGSYDKTICVWNTITGELVAGPLTGHTNAVTSVAFSPNGQHIVSGSDDMSICVWNAVTEEKVASQFIGHTDFVTSVAFSPDGQHIVSGSYDNTIFVWNAVTGETISGPFIGHTDPVRSVAFSPDGQHIVSGSHDNTIRIWDVITGETVAGPFTEHTDIVMSVAFSPDGQHIVSGSDDMSIGVWNAVTREALADPFIGHTNSVMSVAFSPDGQYIVSGSDDWTIYVWNAVTRKKFMGPFTQHRDAVRSVAFSPDGQHIASGSHDNTVRTWNAITGEAVGDPFTGHRGSVKSVAYSPNGQYIVSGSYDKTICVWNAVTGKMVAGPFIGHTDLVMSVTFSPNGQHIVSGSQDQTVRLWDAVTGETVAGPFSGHTDAVLSVAFSPNGQNIVSGSYDRTICVWNAITAERVLGPFTAHTSLVTSVAFSPNGQYIVSGSDDRTICVWNAVTGETVIGPFTGHTDAVTSVVFSSNGQHIVSGSHDNTIRVWTIASRETLPGFAFTDSSVLNRDGWVIGPSDELLVWIPEQHRQCLHRPSNIWIAGKNETCLDLSQFVHGKNWANCYSFV